MYYTVTIYNSIGFVVSQKRLYKMVDVLTFVAQKLAENDRLPVSVHLHKDSSGYVKEEVVFSHNWS